MREYSRPKWRLLYVFVILQIFLQHAQFSIAQNSNLAPRLRGIKQKKLIIHLSSSMQFLLFYCPKPLSQVRILIYRIELFGYPLVFAGAYSVM